MDNPVEEYVDGEFHIDVRFATELEQSQLMMLDRCLDAFISAIENGMFMPARLLDDFIDLFSGNESKNALRKSIVVQKLPLGAFKILHGMLGQLENTIGPFESIGVFQDYDGKNYFDGDLNYPSAYKQPVFFRENNKDSAQAEDLTIQIQFEDELNDERKAHFVKVVNDWNRLISGGYSLPDTPHLFSKFESSHAHFSDSRTLENTLKMFQGNPLCFNLIKNISLSWNGDHPITLVSIH